MSFLTETKWAIGSQAPHSFLTKTNGVQFNDSTVAGFSLGKARDRVWFRPERADAHVNGTVGFGKRLSVTISRNGDLITDSYLEITLRRKIGGPVPHFPAEAFVKAIELEIGGQRIDKHYSDWFRMYDELFRKDDDKAGYRRLTDFGGYGEEDWPEGAVKRFYLPEFDGHKSIALRASGPCSREHRLDFQGDSNVFSRMLVA